MKHPLKLEERTLWQAAMKNVRRLMTGDAQTVLPPSVKIQPAMHQDIGPRAMPVGMAKPAKAISPAPAFLDSETERRLQAGMARIDASLDLHGMTEQQAHGALVAFLENAILHNKRVLLIVTGKGKTGKGVLRHNLPLWLESPSLRPHISGFRRAFDRHGGEGAVYVTLRRIKRN